SGVVGSVKFTLDGKPIQVENYAPFDITGDTNGKPNVWAPTVGKHTLTVTPYAAMKAAGTVGGGKTVQFTVVAGSPTPTPTPTPPPSNTSSFPKSVTFKSIASAPNTLAEAVGTTVNGKLYVLGGFHGSVSPGHFAAQAAGYVYDPATNKWGKTAPMPEPFTHA